MNKANGAITHEILEKFYQDCLKRERTRRWKWRHTEQGAFESSFASFDQMVGEEDDPSKLPWAAEGLGGVISGIDNLPSEINQQHKLKLDYASKKLCRRGRGYLVRTLRLIVRNGKNRKESIWQILMDIMLRKDNTTDTGRSWRHSSGCGYGRRR